ncbi:serine/threonine-protein kinase-like protein At3g51990 [Beta vulgaris subsp. vulgaris]|uniref:serine/threonine-protein kinase-like protein At3g51990 n=1 Tax=Beta vulgaris subsp. vulgaris TaxID=3555 RepID=UPI002036CC7E|nr:serine/threonine-protein kinase-like protein At3g51990 [Beta vulgaris subsp. vulgaris]
MRFLCNADSAISTCNPNSSHHYHRKHKRPVKLTRFSYTDLETATNGFSPLAILGKGSHGAVYRAVLSNSAGVKFTVAVKKYTTSIMETAQNEIDILSKIHSRRIVNLIGFALEPPKLLLVVEYMPNGSLYEYLHQHANPPRLSTRVRFALQIAKAIRTLHNKSDPPVMHRDIKSSNVLLDERENARLSDFGLAIKAHVRDIRVMSTPPAGTLGYLDPCYLAPGDLSTQSDVFSFGILLLELISGRKAIDVDYSPPALVDWALPLIKSGVYEAILDRRIKCFVDRTVVKELALLAARCVRSTAEKRPPVNEIAECLKKVYRRVKMQGFPVWGNLRRRVRHVGRSQPLDEFDGSDWEESRVSAPKYGSRKSLSDRNRKVSNVDGDEGEMTRGGDRTVRLRSKSIGSFREFLKVGPRLEAGVDEINNTTLVVRRRAQVTVKISSVKLSKSRSMSMLCSGKNGFEGKNILRNPQVKELEVFPLLVTCNGRKIKP